MAPKGKVNKKEKEREERERLEKEKEDARREEEDRLKQEKEAAMAAEAERLAQEKLLRLPPKFHFCVAQVGWKMGNPPARYGHVAMNLNGQLFVFSGSVGGNSIGYFFDLSTKQWSQQQLTGEAPPGHMRAAVVQHGAHIYFYGGYGQKGLSTKLHQLDIVSFMWQHLEYTGEAPQLYGMSAIVRGDTMVLFGGRSIAETLSNDTYTFNLNTLQWRQAETSGQPPSKRFSHNAVVSGEQMYVYGGLDTLGSPEPSANREDGNSMYRLDLKSWEWTVLNFKGRGPGPRNVIHGETFSLFKNGLLVALGYQSERVCILNLDQGRWQCCTLTGDLLSPRMHHSATVFLERGVVALFGGQNRKLNQDFNDLFLLKMVVDEDEQPASA
eukprot:GGOE01014176.1.p1 GENE.GGOE01014176.1~~GGOE01014176.1.p1  ORF type:complete len:383 (+),score=70.86 GGOE01014176.1:53-1201(+)